MCVDATNKYPEERADIEQKIVKLAGIEKDHLMQRYPEITFINDRLLKKDISVIAIAVEKNKVKHIQQLHESLVKEPVLWQVKFIIYVDHVVEASDWGVVTWNFSNNIDPKRDVFISSHNTQGISCCGIDGTRKTKKFDQFDRPWPNVIIMDDATIKKVDDRWNSYNIGPFIPSPSLKYKRQVPNEGAVVVE